MQKRPLLFILLFICHSLSIFQDEVGEIDWYLQNVGIVNYASFLSNSIIVGTDQHIIASLDPTEGSIQWRKIMEPDRSVVDIMASEKGIWALVQSSDLIELILFAPSGKIVSQFSTPINPNCKLFLDASSNQVATLSDCEKESTLIVRNLEGKITFNSTTESLHALGFQLFADRVEVLSYQNSEYSFHVQYFDGQTPSSIPSFSSSAADPTSWKCSQGQCTLITSSKKSVVFSRKESTFEQKSESDENSSWQDPTSTFTLVQKPDGALQKVNLSTKKVEWTREEGLSHLDQVLFVELQPHHGGDLYGLQPLLVALNGQQGVLFGLKLDRVNNQNTLTVQWKHKLESTCPLSSSQYLSSIVQEDSAIVHVVCGEISMKVMAYGPKSGEILTKSATSGKASLQDAATGSATWGFTNKSVFGSILAGNSPTWEFFLPPGQKILTYSHVAWDEPLHSYAKLTGPKTAFPKYLNKNLLAISATSDTSATTPGTPSGVFVYVLDSLNGNLLFSITHENGTDPVHMISSENFIVYHFWNREMMSFEVGTLELFETEFQWQNPNKNQEIRVFSNSFLFPYAVEAIAVSMTSRGITGKAIFFGLSTGQIVAFPRNLLDPRRPLKTNINPEEALIPYELYLPNPFLSKSVFNYYQKVAKIRHIQTAPTYLESTSLFIAFGADIYLSRIAPSESFDLLNNDFNYFALIATTAFLLGAAIVTHYIDKDNEFRRLWK